MIPDLGKYAVHVLSAYGASLFLLAGLVWLTLARGARLKRQLADAEATARPASDQTTTETP